MGVILPAQPALPRPIIIRSLARHSRAWFVNLESITAPHRCHSYLLEAVSRYTRVPAVVTQGNCGILNFPTRSPETNKRELVFLELPKELSAYSLVGFDLSHLPRKCLELLKVKTFTGKPSTKS